MSVCIVCMYCMYVLYVGTVRVPTYPPSLLYSTIEGRTYRE